jgi:septin family protein
VEHTVRCIGEDQLDKTAFLPSLVMKYELNSKQNLRLGLSKTYTLQFKESAFIYEEVLQVKVGIKIYMLQMIII